MAFPASKKLNDSEISQTVLVDWSIIVVDLVYLDYREMVRMASSSSMNRRNDEFVSFDEELKFPRIVRLAVGRK